MEGPIRRTAWWKRRSGLDMHVAGKVTDLCAVARAKQGHRAREAAGLDQASVK